jgi:hypothetical protein
MGTDEEVNSKELAGIHRLSLMKVWFDQPSFYLSVSGNCLPINKWDLLSSHLCCMTVWTIHYSLLKFVNPNFWRNKLYMKIQLVLMVHEFPSFSSLNYLCHLPNPYLCAFLAIYDIAQRSKNLSQLTYTAGNIQLSLNKATRYLLVSALIL